MLTKLAPVIGTFLSGALLRRVGLVKRETGEWFLRLIFFLTLPCLILDTVPGLVLSAGSAALPICAAMIVSITGTAAWLTGTRTLKLTSPRLGVLVNGSMIMNLGFMIPFVSAIHGREGVGLLLIMDLGNSLPALSVGYYLACRLGDAGATPAGALKKALSSPPLICLATALAMNFRGLSLPEWLSSFIGPVGAATLPLTMVTLGALFDPRAVMNPANGLRRAVATGIVLRSCAGLAIGLVLCRSLGMTGLPGALLVAGAAAPVGYNTLTFSILAGLDRDFAASLVSVSLGIGLFAVPLSLALLGP